MQARIFKKKINQKKIRLIARGFRAELYRELKKKWVKSPAFRKTAGTIVNNLMRKQGLREIDTTNIRKMESAWKVLGATVIGIVGVYYITMREVARRRRNLKRKEKHRVAESGYKKKLNARVRMFKEIKDMEGSNNPMMRELVKDARNRNAVEGILSVKYGMAKEAEGKFRIKGKFTKKEISDTFKLLGEKVNLSFKQIRKAKGKPTTVEYKVKKK